MDGQGDHDDQRWDTLAAVGPWVGHCACDYRGVAGSHRSNPQRVFNVGEASHNYRVREIAQIVDEVFPGCRVTFGAAGHESRSYRVSLEKIRKHLPGFRCAWDARRGAKQLYDLFKRIDMTKDVFEYRTFTRLKQLEYLIQTQQIDPQFFWTNEDRRGA